ncbi:hypothetical protein ENSA5_00390 [Enhygromyxa salina]|uniref:DUF2169 domain-containing protein n=1 Tax=Enhygromyxa salina TaxID=215803 RepID=A0A2S9YLD7_9BACT|nr:DUF2169 domain-containing protein [Enhygromyxa salina]PRQ05888.1 hypothetical protein ENSA5_00390 [Enhygromyxa salina]
MQITRDSSGLRSALTTWTDPQGALSCVVVIKGTYKVHDGRLRPSEHQRDCETIDSYEGEPGSSSLRSENDFAPYKPAIDVLVRGHAWAPKGRPCTDCVVELRVGAASKRLRVHGDRVWRPGVVGLVPGVGHPFERQPLRWELAYGGTTKAGCEQLNPVGVGLADGVSEHEAVGSRAPSIESLDAPIQRWGPRYLPAGLAAIARSWQPRLAAAGTFDDAWRRDRFPLLPDDFGFEHFQVAPPDQRVATLAPGTAIAVAGMSRAGLFVAEVPPPPPLVHFHFDDRVVERTAMLDTIVLEPEPGLLLASWRTRVPLGRKPALLREIVIGPRRGPKPRRSAKPHFRSLGEFVTWAKRRRGVQRS